MTVPDQRRQIVVLKVVHYPVFGGPHNQALRMDAPLRARGWKLCVLVPNEPGNATARLRAGGVEVVPMPLHRFRARPDPRVQLGFWLGFVPEVARIRRLIRRRQIGLVTIGGLVNPHAAIAARLEGVPVVWQIVDSRTPRALRAVLVPLILRLADALMFDGQALIDLHVGGRSIGLPSIVYYPPVDTKRFTPSAERRHATRQHIAIPDGAPLVGMVANLNPQKGIEYFIRAAADIYRGRPDSWFLIVGARYETHRDYSEHLKAEIRRSGVPPERFCFAGDRPDVENYYPAMDVKLITSVPRSEGTTTTAMEAMACGLPVVATDVGAVREVVEDGATGFVVPPLDPAAIAGATLRLLRDPDLCARMGAEARRRAVERYDVQVCTDTHVRAFEAAIAHHRLRLAARLDRPAPADATTARELRVLLVCPACHGALAWSDEAVRCAVCARAYPMVDGIPVLLLDQAAATHDELEHLHAHARGHDHKRRQAAYFDRHDAAEFEITRPHGTPVLHRWLLGEKFRRSVTRLGFPLTGATALTVCGGSGMDAGFLARAGARVITSDISLGAARRAAERARRYRLPILSVVADVERLPFADRAIDLVHVHDGLHHLERPAAGLGEMARVATRAVSVTEPARASVTALAVRLGLALEREEAGNRVMRLTADEVGAVLRSRGLRVVHAERYAMYYRHEPGPLTAALSRPGAFLMARALWRTANGAFGRIGNKLVVQATRPPDGRGTT